MVFSMVSMGFLGSKKVGSWGVFRRFIFSEGIIWIPIGYISELTYLLKTHQKWICSSLLCYIQSMLFFPLSFTI